MPVKLNTRAMQTAELKRRAWLPSGAIDESVAVRFANVTLALASGTLQLMGNLVVPAGVTVANITVRVATGASSPTNGWFCLVRQSDLSVLAKTADDGSTAWSGFKTLALASSWTAPVDTAVYAGIVSVAATAAVINAATVSGTMMNLAPVLCGASTTGLTNPASLGATAAAPSAGSQFGWAYLS